MQQTETITEKHNQSNTVLWCLVLLGMSGQSSEFHYFLCDPQIRRSDKTQDGGNTKINVKILCLLISICEESNRKVSLPRGKKKINSKSPSKIRVSNMNDRQV